MNSDDQFYAVLMKIIGVVCSVLILSVASCTMYGDFVTVEAIKHGDDPLRVKCAFSTSTSALHFCSILAAKDMKP